VSFLKKKKKTYFQTVQTFRVVVDENSEKYLLRAVKIAGRGCSSRSIGTYASCRVQSGLHISGGACYGNVTSAPDKVDLYSSRSDEYLRPLDA